MKNKIITITAILTILGVSIISCNKFLTIQPHFEFTSEIATTSLDGLTKTTNGAFSALQSSNLYGGGTIAYPELMGDFVYADAISDYSLNQFRTRQLEPSNGDSGGMWNSAYGAIYIANVVLQYAPAFTSQSASQVQLIRGESYFIRAIMHFELLRVFAQPSGYTSDDSHPGIPIVLTPGTITTGQSTPRSTVAQCYKQIILDLDSAAALLPASNAAIASQGAAQAFLARVYFSQHQYQNALNYTNLVINSGLYSLNDSVTSIYNSVGANNGSNDNEAIFQQLSYVPGANNSTAISTSTTSAVNTLEYSNGTLVGNFYAVFEHGANFACSEAFHTGYYVPDSLQNGLRSNLLYHWVSLNFQRSIVRLFTHKYDNAYMNVTIIRLAEMYLDRAECNARLGAADAVVRADYNMTRVRAGLIPDNSTSGQQALLNAIWGERDMELAFEGDRFFEIKRRQISFTSPESGQTFAWNSPQLVYPIPLQEVLQNKNMVQNAGY